MNDAARSMHQPPAAADLDHRVLREHVASVYAAHTTATCAHIGFAIAIGIFGYLNIDSTHHLLVIGMVAAVVSMNLYALLAPRWTPDVPLSESHHWARRYTWIVTLVSVTTALPCALFLVLIQSPAMTTVVIVVIMVSWTRAIQARWPIKGAMFGCGIPVMSGLILALIWHGGTLHWFLALFSFANLVLTLHEGVKQNKRLTASLMLQFENEMLAAQLRERIAAVERASAEKTRFLAAASHDLRQPMHAIALFGAAMETALHDHPERTNAKRLMRAVDALGASLDTMLDVSHLDAGVVVSEPQALELDALLLVLNQTFTPYAEQKGLQLRVRASGMWVRSDIQLLFRLLSNLVDNALKYTHEGGVSVVARRRGDKVWLEVRDTGVGIAPEQLSRIFEEFYQVDNPGRDRARGLGIGLSIVQRLSHLMSHPIEVHSRPGRGTHFRVVLPQAKAAITAPAELLLDELEIPAHRSLAAPNLHGPVLLIDDEAEIRLAMAALLRAHAVDVVAVTDESHAVEALTHPDAKSRPFSMLLCDYRLADGGDGLEVGLRLLERFQLDIPLLLITGETAPQQLRRAQSSGVPMLFKPVSAAALLQAMAELTSVTGQTRIFSPATRYFRDPSPVT
ncbi:ATP-binding response regulator [Variovorax boronicumulans]|uniref:ATP-binding response regulator n=1 Tax=Variovorax boronicumulans TaxID=436515 RepID=UPI001F24D9C2|nr:hybrid sensor histidine kinase/response regulator [Variovorax boronicumulans]